MKQTALMPDSLSAIHACCRRTRLDARCCALDVSQAVVQFALQAPGADGQSAQAGLWAQDTDRIGADGDGAGASLYGFRFTSWGNGIQWENTASAVMALLQFKKVRGATRARYLVAVERNRAPVARVCACGLCGMKARRANACTA
eukprot:6204455-Pleurochrysis_carterae.AAC.3